MQKCTNCSGILLPGALFCHKCGTKIVIETPTIAVETENNVVQATLVFDTIFDKKSSQTSEKETITDKNKTHQLSVGKLKILFFEVLHARVIEEHLAEEYSEFVERYYQHHFEKVLIEKTNWLNDEFFLLDKKMVQAQKMKEIIVQKAIENLIDYFILQHCKDLSDIFLSEKTLQYADMKLSEVNILTFINDFLQLKEENLLIYKDFITMPQEKLKNAFQAFLHTERDEMVYFICDLSLTGTCKEGFAFSNKRLYWRMPLNKTHSISFDNIVQVKKEKEWIEINGGFFNVNKRLNMKLLRMLKKMKLMGM